MSHKITGPPRLRVSGLKWKKFESDAEKNAVGPVFVLKYRLFQRFKVSFKLKHNRQSSFMFGRLRSCDIKMAWWFHLKADRTGRPQSLGARPSRSVITRRKLFIGAERPRAPPTCLLAATRWQIGRNISNYQATVAEAVAFIHPIKPAQSSQGRDAL